MSYGDCPVCFDELTEANYRIVCGNQHYLCETCFKEQVKPREVELDWGQAGTEYTASIPTNCPVCRDPMLVWEEDLPEAEQEGTRRIQIEEVEDEPDFIVVDGIIVRGLGIERIRRGQRPAATQELEDASERIRQQLRREREENQRQLALRDVRAQQEAIDRALAMVNPVEQAIIAMGDINQPRQRRVRRRAQRCSVCRRTGHNRRSCPNQ